jgi:HlyD family secretion protein
MTRRTSSLIVVVIVITLGLAVWRLAFDKTKTSDSVVFLSGRIEGDDSALAPKTSGRIADVRFREGDSVKAGDTVAVLDDQQVRAREEQARAALAVGVARELAARTQLAAFQEQLEQTQVQTGQSKMDAEGRVRQAEAELASAEAELAARGFTQARAV